MTKKTTTKAPKTEEERGTLYEAARKVLMAGIGAVALAQDEAENFVNKLVERGEL
ncbi:MAG TPA: poly(hydroxyalkanoate) granule-associated protein, partial [Chloroflexi bacterium]|nr:poly(hydroxyalkanoate) granule-associated protein [Chloroflexota bacterium]